jgi:hypothetical protein
MSLSEVIARLKPDESVKFTREVLAVEFVAKKGDEELPCKEVSFRVDTDDIEQGRIDILAIEVRRALDILRHGEATDGN